MNAYVIQGATLTGIADAIREKLGNEQQYTPESMAVAIGGIQGADAIISGRNMADYKNSTVTRIRQFVFSYSAIETAAFLSVNLVESSAFQGSELKMILFSSAVAFSGIPFSGCSNLSTVILASDSVCTLSDTGAFRNTPIASGTGYIYVPDDLVDQYKVGTNWTTYANQIKGRSEIPAEVQEWLSQMEEA